MKQKYKKFIILTIAVAMVSLYSFVPPRFAAQAVDSIVDASDTITDSDYGVVADHTLDFTTGTTTPAGGFWRVTFPAGFTNVGSGAETCAWGDGNFAASTTGQIVDCVVTADEAATTSRIVITNVNNPNPGTPTSYPIIIELFSDYGVSIPSERVSVRVAILGNVWMTARVDSTLAFSVDGMLTGEDVNGINCDADTTATTTPFESPLPLNATSTVCQELSVASNADDGFIVTVEQDDELRSDSNSTINSFDNSPDGTGSSTPHLWKGPFSLLDQYHTYGHMGVTSEDTNLNADSGGQYADFYNGSTALYAGLTNATPMVVMHHTGPTLGTTPTYGLTQVAYSIQIGALQEAGDYETTLTYICTPTY